MLREKLHAGPVSTLWFWPATVDLSGLPSTWPACSAVCTLAWDSPGVASVHGLLGSINRRNLRELMDFCLRRGIHTIKAYRRDGRRLPGAVKVGDHVEIDLRALLVRVRP